MVRNRLTIFQRSTSSIRAQLTAGEQRSQKQNPSDCVFEKRQPLIFRHVGDQSNLLLVRPVFGTLEEGSVARPENASRERAETLCNAAGMSDDLVGSLFVVSRSIKGVDDVALDGRQMRTVLEVLRECAEGRLPPGEGSIEIRVGNGEGTAKLD